MPVGRRPVVKVYHVLQYKMNRQLCGTVMSEMQTEEFELQALDKHSIRGSHWYPPGPVRGVLQIFHGLGEHRTRYERFAMLVTMQGFSVVAHDHRGHGSQAYQSGYFSDVDGWQKLTDDGLLVNDMIGERYRGVPIILLGHSMGSYIAQYFSMQHGYRLSALILSASTWPLKLKIMSGLAVAQIESMRIGIRGTSALLHKLGFGNLNKPFSPSRTELDWLSRDEAEVDTYISDPFCGGPYTCGLWIDLLRGLKSIAADSALRAIQGNLPILITGGADDPVGGERGMTELTMHYAKSGHNCVSSKIYPGGRHEMLNEINRDEFSADLLDWIEKQLPGVASA